VISASCRLLAQAIAVLLVPASAGAQAFTPPPRVGSVTLGWQWVDNTGHILTDGTLFPRGQSVTTSLMVEVDYGVTERFAATMSVPFVFARYTGDLPPFSGLERDACRCWNQSFQDLSIAGRYRFGDEFWAITPQVRFVLPTHDYPYRGEAVVGPNLQQLQLGIGAAWRLAPVLPKASIQAGYTFALTEAVEDVRPNRSNLTTSFGYALTRSLFVHGGALFQKTHGGITAFGLAVAPPEQAAQADRLLKMRFWHMTGGVSYSTRFADLFFSVEPYVWGRDTHDGIAYTVGSTWYFDFSRAKP
jgi:outer membrane putative beta-barrel porin/alpha-amylase